MMICCAGGYRLYGEIDFGSSKWAIGDELCTNATVRGVPRDGRILRIAKKVKPIVEDWCHIYADILCGESDHRAAECPHKAASSIEIPSERLRDLLNPKPGHRRKGQVGRGFPGVQSRRLPGTQSQNKTGEDTGQ
jgi:hypothetical protein